VTELFNLDLDPAERYDVSAEHPDLVERLKARMQIFGSSIRADSRPPANYIERVSAID
jgi:hypothetical protein